MRQFLFGLIGLLAAAPIAAQTPGAPETGLWLGAGAGFSGGSYECDACAGELPSGPYGSISLGWATSGSLAYTVEVVGSAGADGVVSHRGGLVLAQVEFHPFADRRLYLAGAGGFGRFEASVDRENGEDALGSSGLAYGIVAGWSLPFSGPLSAHPEIGYYRLAGGDFNSNGTSVGLSGGRSMMRLGLSVRWYGVGGDLP